MALAKGVKRPEKVVVIYTRFGKPLADKVARLARDERRSVAAQVEVLAEEAIRRREQEKAQ